MKNWKKTLLNENSSIGSAIKSLNESELQIVLVVKKNLKLIGTITDGDIRRKLLSGHSIKSSIKKIINKNCLTVSRSTSDYIMNKLMEANDVYQLPIVDKNKKVIGLKTWREPAISDQIENKIVVMAGGKGRRMLPYTKKYPKPLLVLGNKPILEHILIKAKSEGFKNFVLAINYLGHMIEKFFKNGNKLNVKIKYIKEKKPLGTAGALSLLNPKPKFPIIVCNGDVISDIRFRDLLDFHIKNRAHITVAVKPHELRNPYGVIEINGNKIIGLKEKPVSKSYINAGVYVLDPIVFKHFRKVKYLDMVTLIKKLTKKTSRILAFPAYEYWADIGRPKDYFKVNKRLI
tara:strand:+ start:10307 stop:11344 length:1038 start_codon:yes stop_codon:yes gene_type:complete